MAIQLALGELRLDADGGLGRLDPLDGADLAVKIGHPDIGAFLKKLDLPLVATGPLTADVRLKDAGDLTRLDLTAKLGDISAKAGGTLRVLGLPGSDLRFEATVASAARLGEALGATGLPSGALELAGHLVSSRSAVSVEALTARFAGARARVDGKIGLAAASATELRFEAAAPSLAKLREGLPGIVFSLAGAYAADREKIEVKNVKGRIGESRSRPARRWRRDAARREWKPSSLRRFST